MKNYALITEQLSDLLVESYEKKDKKFTNKLIKEVRENKKLKSLYALVYNLKYGKVNESSVDNFIQENIKASKEFDFSEFDNILTEALSEKYSNEVLDSIGVLLFEKKSIFNLQEYNNAYNVVKNNLLKETLKKNKLTKEINESSLDVEDKRLVEKFMQSSKEEKITLFRENKEQCISAINKKLKETDSSETKLKLYEVKDMLSNMEYDDKEFIQEMVKVHELKKNLLV